MIKFYFNGSPNPTKVALFLEEAGLAYEPHPVDTRMGDQFKPEFVKSTPMPKSLSLLMVKRLCLIAMPFCSIWPKKQASFCLRLGIKTGRSFCHG